MKQLERALTQLGISSDSSRIEKFRIYMEGILNWNKMVNLTSITDPEEFIEKHYMDSLLCVSYDEFQNSNSIIDVGTGGGFPGVPLAIAAPEKEFLLIDSLNKRIKIINELCEKAEIKNVTAIHGRAEELAKNKKYRQKFDLCVSRAVANLSVLSEYCLPFIKKGGWFLAYKGPDIREELKESRKAIQILGGEVKKEEQPILDGFSLEHKIIFIEKTGSTPSKFPRKAGTPSKEPLK